MESTKHDRLLEIFSGVLGGKICLFKDLLRNIMSQQKASAETLTI